MSGVQTQYEMHAAEGDDSGVGGSDSNGEEVKAGRSRPGMAAAVYVVLYDAVHSTKYAFLAFETAGS